MTTKLLTSESIPCVGHSVIGWQIEREPYSKKPLTSKRETYPLTECSLLAGNNIYKIVDSHGNHYLCEVI